MKNYKRQNGVRRRGFTLLELLVVIAIIGILSTITIVSLSRARARARDAKRIADMEQLQTILALYASYHENEYPNEYPAAAGLLHACAVLIDDGEICVISENDLWISALAPYTQRLPSDPRGWPEWEPYRYKRHETYGYILSFKMEANPQQDECKIPNTPLTISTRCARQPSS
jgi:prepilin-type N-terminal cleavage/methylation domain-containing protein